MGGDLDRENIQYTQTLSKYVSEETLVITVAKPTKTAVVNCSIYLIHSLPSYRTIGKSASSTSEPTADLEFQQSSFLSFELNNDVKSYCLLSPNEVHIEPSLESRCRCHRIGSPSVYMMLSHCGSRGDLPSPRFSHLVR